MAMHNIFNNAIASVISPISKIDCDNASPFLVDDTLHQRDGRTTYPSSPLMNDIDVEFMDQRPKKTQEKIPEVTN